MFVIGYFIYGDGSRFLTEYSPDGYSFDYGRRNALTFNSRDDAEDVLKWLEKHVSLRARDELFIDFSN